MILGSWSAPTSRCPSPPAIAIASTNSGRRLKPHLELAKTKQSDTLYPWGPAGPDGLLQPAAEQGGRLVRLGLAAPPVELPHHPAGGIVPAPAVGFHPGRPRGGGLFFPPSPPPRPPLFLSLFSVL